MQANIIQSSSARGSPAPASRSETDSEAVALAAPTIASSSNICSILPRTTMPVSMKMIMVVTKPICSQMMWFRWRHSALMLKYDLRAVARPKTTEARMPDTPQTSSAIQNTAKTQVMTMQISMIGSRTARIQRYIRWEAPKPQATPPTASTTKRPSTVPKSVSEHSATRSRKTQKTTTAVPSLSSDSPPMMRLSFSGAPSDLSTPSTATGSVADRMPPISMCVAKPNSWSPSWLNRNHEHTAVKNDEISTPGPASSTEEGSDFLNTW